MSQTLQQLAQELKQKFKSLDQNKVILIAGNAGLDAIENRIFNDSETTSGAKLPTKPYSTNPISVPVSSLPRRAGEISESGKSSFFAGGYAQLKKEVGRKPLELTGALRRDFSAPVISGGDNLITYELKTNENADKAESLTRQYGEIFAPNKEEADLIARVYTNELFKRLF
jgi:hypothetical protein